MCIDTHQPPFTATFPFSSFFSYALLLTDTYSMVCLYSSLNSKILFQNEVKRESKADQGNSEGRLTVTQASVSPDLFPTLPIN